MKLAATAVLCYKIRNDKSVVHLAVSNQERKELAVTESEDKPKLTRKQARELGEKHYYSEKPCIRGHEPKRFAISNDCVQCLFERDRKRFGPLKQGVIKSTREIALEAGLKHYFTGKPCPKGHIAPRHVSSYGCTVCSLEKRRIFYKTKRSIAREQALKWQKANPEKYKESIKKSKKKHYERIRKRAIAAYWKDPEKGRVASKIWRENNPEKKREIAHKNIAQRAKAVGKHTANEIRELFLKQNKKCANCFITITMESHKKHTAHLDHILPLSKGGSNWIHNLQFLCRTCNLRKHAKDPLAFAQEQGRLL